MTPELAVETRPRRGRPPRSRCRRRTPPRWPCPRRRARRSRRSRASLPKRRPSPTPSWRSWASATSGCRPRSRCATPAAEIVGIDISAARLQAIRAGEAELLASEQQRPASASRRRRLRPDRAHRGARRGRPGADLRAHADRRAPPARPRDPARGVRRGRAPRPSGPDAGADLDHLCRHAPASCWSSRWPSAGCGSARTCSSRSPPSASTPACPTTSSCRRRACSAGSPRPASGGRRRCCATPARTCTASPRPRPPRWSSCTRTPSARSTSRSRSRSPKPAARTGWIRSR